MRKLIFCLLSSGLLHSQNVITTVASSPAFQGSGGQATSAILSRINGVAVDSTGNIYVSDADNCLVLKTATNGVITAMAGNGVCSHSGDGGPALTASLNAPTHLAVDLAGNVYVADSNNYRIRKVTPSGVITTVAGTGDYDYFGDNGPATSAALAYPNGIAVDSFGNLYIADTDNNAIRKVTNGVMTTIAGTGVYGFSGDGGSAKLATLKRPFGVTVDAAGNVYIADTENNRIRRINTSGTISTIAGTGSPDFSGDGGAATAASLYFPEDVALDGGGNIYVVDYNNARIRKFTVGGAMSTVAGNGTGTFAGDGGPAGSAALNLPTSLTVDSASSIYIADTGNHRLRKVTAGTISTVVGTVQLGDGALAIRANLANPSGVAVDSTGNLYIADASNNRIRKVDLAGNITTFAGTGVRGFSGDNGPATSAQLAGPVDVRFDSIGNLYICDYSNNRIRKVSLSGVITTVAGNGQAAFSGDGGPATSASLYRPSGVAFDGIGAMYIADYFNSRIRRVSPTGIMGTVGGNGNYKYSGEGSDALNVAMDPVSVNIDNGGNLYISDRYNNRIRKIAPSRAITTVAGNGSEGYSGDEGLATSARLNMPNGVTFDSFGNFYIADDFNAAIRQVTSDGYIYTVAGTGTSRFGGDGGDALDADLWDPVGLSFDNFGNLLIADSSNNRIRKVFADLPQFSVSPASLAFSAPSGSAGYTQQVEISSAVNALPWTATSSVSSGSGWLTITPTSGKVPASISVSVNATSLGAGTYNGTVTVSSTLADPSTRSISVQFVVAPALATQISVQPSTFTFSGQAGAANPVGQTLRIGNSGAGTFNWTAAAATSAGGNWLQLSQSSGAASSAAPVNVTVTANVGSLAQGTYSGSITVNGGSAGSVTIPVTLLVAAATSNKIILLSQTGLPYTGVQGGSMIPPQTFGVLNTGQGSMSWTASATTDTGGGWLSVTPSSGTTDANSLTIPQVSVGVNTTGLVAGVYTGVIRIVATGAVNTPQFVTVKLNVLAPGSNPGVLVRPTGLIFAVQAGTRSPSSQTINVGTAHPQGTDYASGIITRSGAWLQMSPMNAVLNVGQMQSVTVQPSLGTLAAGVYQGTITLQFRDGSAQTVSVLFQVVTGSEVNAQGLGVAGAACNPTKLVATDRSLGNNFNSPVSYPQQIEIQVQDDCGNNVTNATVVASFSNGDSPLGLANLKNGLYSGTWQPARTLSQLTVTINAFAPALTPGMVQAFGRAPDNPNAPAMSSGGVVNGASFAAGAPMAPGAIVSLFGKNLASGTNAATSLPLNKNLGGATATVAGIDMPLYFSNSGQINAQLPYELTPNSQVQVIVRTTANGTLTATVPETITVAAASPAIFGAGGGAGVVLHADNTLVTASNPARGNEQVVVYCTGLGPTNPSFPTGSPATSANDTVNPVAVTIGGRNAPVAYKGLTVGFVGLYQVNVIIPTGLSGAQPILMTVGSGNTSPSGVTVNVAP